MKQVVKTNGLELPREYKILVIAGGSPANLARLASGQIAATTIAVPLNFVAEEAGFNAIGFSQEAFVAAWDVARRGDALVCAHR